MSLELLAALAVVFLAGLINGLTGFGFALVGAPFLLLFYQPVAVVVIKVTLSLFTSAYVLIDALKHVNWQAVGALAPFAVVGAFVGAQVLKSVNPEYIQLGIGVVITVTALLMLRHVRLPGARTRPATGIAGFVSGILGTSTALGGPPIVLLFNSRGMPKHEFRGTSSAYFLLLTFVGLGLFYARDILRWEYVSLSLALVPAVFAGNFVGAFLARRTPEGIFRTITLAVVVVTGVLGAATALRALL